MTGMSYDPARKLATTSRGFIVVDEFKNTKYTYNPVPYNIDFSLYIMVKNAEDGTRILEQILPFFTPEWTTTVNLIPSVDAKLDIPVIIGGLTSEDTYEGGVDDRRTIIWTVNFTLKGYIFGPVRKASNEIKFSTTNFFSSFANTSTGENVTGQPGLAANGSPTTDPALTVDYNLIDSGQDWTYIIQRGKINP